MSPALRLVAGVCALSMTAAVHAATPITLPLGDLGIQVGDKAAIELPVPPPPVRKGKSQPSIQLIIKARDTGGCTNDSAGRAADRREVSAVPDPWATKPVWSRLG